MGNSGIRKLFFHGDYVETKYDNLFQLKALDLEKKEQYFSQFKNKICLCVNVSSQGKDSQQQLQSLNELKSAFPNQQFEILAFPSNQFFNESKSFTELKEFYKDFKYKIFQKIEVNGQYMHPVFKFLKRHSDLYNIKLINAGEINEDFNKFLVKNDGKVFKFYRKNVQNKDIQRDIEELINAQNASVPNNTVTQGKQQ